MFFKFVLMGKDIVCAHQRLELEAAAIVKHPYPQGRRQLIAIVLICRLAVDSREIDMAGPVVMVIGPDKRSIEEQPPVEPCSLQGAIGAVDSLFP